MIVVDSSVWIANLRDHTTEATVKLASIVDEREILIGDLVLLEVLRGARTEAEAKQIEQELNSYTTVQMLGVQLARRAAANYRSLRKRGITIRSSIDLVIGTFCIEGHHTLLQNDRDFLPMGEYLGLQLL